MPLYSIQGPDGKTYSIEGPPGATREQVIQAIQARMQGPMQTMAPPAPQPEESGFFRQVLDVPVQVARGGVGGIRMLADVFGAGSSISQSLKSADTWLADLLSAEAQKDQQKVAQILKDAENKGVLDQVKAGFQAFLTAPADLIAQALGSTAPVVIAGLASGPAGAVLGTARLGAAVMPAVGAAMGVGEVKGSIYEAVEQAYKAQGASDEEARAKALEAQSYASANLPSIIAGGGLGAIAGGMGIERPLVSMLGRGAVRETAEQQALREAERGLVSRVGLGALTEAAPEFAQGAQSQLAQNIALRQEGFDVPLFQGVFGAGTLEATAGAVLGGGLAIPRTGVERLPGQGENESDVAFARRMSREIEAARQREQSPLLQPVAPVAPAEAPVAPSAEPEEDMFRLPDGSVGTLDQARAYVMSLPPAQRIPTLQGIMGQRVQKEKVVPPDLFTQKPTEVTAAEAAVGEPTKPLELAPVEIEKPATEISEQAKPTEVKPAQAVTKEEEEAAADAQVAEQKPEQYGVSGYPIVELPLDQLTLSTDVPQFKSDADAKGVVEPLGGQFDRRGVAPIQVWKRTDGRMEVISGRHRLDLAQRSGEQTIPAQIHEEATGFNAQQAAMLDAELNIRDQQGKVKDYVAYFENAGISEADADARGLLARAPGKQGFAIASKGSPELVAAHRADVIPDAGAAAIANAAPGDSRLQAVGIKAIQEGKSPLAAVNTIKAVQAISKDRPPSEGGDLFGFDDSAMREAEEMAKIATLKQNQIAQRLAAISGASRRPEIAKKEGIDIKDPEALKKREKELRQQKASWDNWPSSPELVEEIRKEMAPKPEEKPSVREAEPKELPKDVEAKIDALGKALQRILTRYGLKDVGVRLVADMKAEGEYASKVLSLALDAADPVVALRHEAIHAMKELGFFSPAQWKSLERQAKEKWVDQYLKQKNVNRQPLQEGQISRHDAYMKFYGGDQEAILEEAIADAFADFSATKAPPGMLQALLKKIQNFFQGIKEAFGAEPEAERIFRKAERGELRAKPEVSVEAEEVKPSLRVVEGKEKPDLGKNVTVDTVGKYFDDQVVQQFGGKLNYNSPEHFNRAVKQAIEEVKYQIKQKNSGLDWYEEDVQKAFKNTIKVLPQLKKEDNRILFSMMAGIMSPETNARDNWFIAAKAFEHYINTGDIPGVNPENGNLWMGGTQSANKKIQLEFLDRMVKDLGLKKAIRWLLNPQSVKDINQYRAKYGLLKSGIGGKATDLKPNGLFAFGEKIGPFISNLNGIHDVTVDKWFIRTFNRYFGTMIGPDGKIINAPTEPQRRVVKELANRVAKDAGIKNYQVQSLLWFYEQRLFTQLGAQSPSYGFSDGSKKFLDARGKGAVPAGTVPAEQVGAGRAKPSLRDKLGLYSELEAKVSQGPGKGTAEAWKGYINGLTQKGVKPEEIEWSGVRDWLDLQKGSVTKEDLLAYLKNGGVQVEETVLGGREPWRERLDLLETKGYRNLSAAEKDELEELRDRFDREGPTTAPESRQAKYSQYTLPGGENYREVLLTIPDISRSEHERAKRAWVSYQEQMREKYNGSFAWRRKATKEENAEADRLIAELDKAAYGAPQNRPEFRSRHWDQPNVLAHIRVNDRTDADGNKVLFVEEIQSDWGQEGKKRGFIAGDWKESFEEWKRGLRERAKLFYLDGADTEEERAIAIRLGEKLAAREDIDSIATVMGERRQLGEAWDKAIALRDRIPAAPFVTKTEGWLNLALKRIMVMAAEGGYDKVAFVNGDQSAERYDLSKQVDRIDYNKNGDGTYNISAIRKGAEVFSKENLKESEVEDTVGKELAAKMVRGEGKEVAELEPVDRWEAEEDIYTAKDFDYEKTKVMSLSGLDLKVGGEGMKTFYDTIVPTAIKKLLPKVGGGQMAAVKMGEGARNLEVMPHPDDPDGYAIQDIDDGQWYDPSAEQFRNEAPERMYRSEARARAQIDYIVKGAAPVLNQPGFDVTPSMKERVRTTGLPRFSLRDTTDPVTRARIDQVTTPREEKSFIKRITEAIAPKSSSTFRAAFLDRYNRLSEYDKELVRQMGGAPLLADASSHSAALMSDLSAGVLAGAMGVHDGVGGIPVYVNGYTKISNQNNTIKGPIAIFAPLAKYNDPFIYQKYQFWAAVNRGLRLYAQGRDPKMITPADQAEAAKILADHPEFADIQKEWIKFNDGLVQYLKDTGVLSDAAAQEFVKYADYIPFYRQVDGEETVGPQIFASLSGVRAPKKLKGSETPLGEFLETVVRNVQYSIEAGMKNVAAQRAVNTAVAIGQANKLNYVSSAPNVIKVLENGKTSYYETQDLLFVEAMKSLNLGDLPFIGLLAGPANLLRNLVTKDPAFMLANMMRDSMSAWVSSGVKMTPFVDTLTNFTKALRNQNPEYSALLNSGVIGGYDYSQGVDISARRFERALRKEAGVYTPAEKLARPFTSLWDALEKGTTASDAATRMEVYKKTLAETGNEAEALFRAVEVMNFNRKGNNPLVRVLTAAVPFLNARMQGLDVLYRAAFGKGTEANAAEIQKRFFVRGMTIAALSAMYWLLAHEDDEWKRQEQETRDNYWILGDIKIPIPFEIGVLFKVIPERILEYSFGDDTGKDFLKSMTRQLTSTLSFNPIPQTALPLIESVTNYSFFTGRPIVSQGLEDVAPAYQIAPGTSRVGELIGGATKDLPTALQISPVKIDEMIRGYTGTIGGYMMDLFDAIYDMNTDAPKAAKRFEQMPVIRRFAVDPLARGQVTAYYELKNSVDEAVRTANLLERNMKPQEWGEFMQENMGLLATKDYVLDLEKSMKQYREMKNFVRASAMGAEEKKDIIANITELENNLASNIQQIKKMIAAQ